MEKGLPQTMKDARRAKGWSQARLAYEAGVPQSAISDIESGKRKNPGVKTLSKIAAALEVRLSVLIDSNDALDSKGE